MNLHHLLNARRAAGKPVRVALIGAGKFGSMFLSQVPHTPGLEVPVIVDLDPQRAREACRTVGWDEARIAATTFTADARQGDIGQHRSDRGGDRQSRGRHQPCPRRDRGGQAHRHGQCRGRRAGGAAARARKRASAGVVYSLAYGDQPALTAEMVDWARATGFRVVAAGKGTKYLPAYHDVTPDRGLEPLRADRRRGAVGRHESADVQLVSRRHQVGDRNGGDRQCHRARRAGRAACCFRPAASTICRM